MGRHYVPSYQYGFLQKIKDPKPMIYVKPSELSKQYAARCQDPKYVDIRLKLLTRRIICSTHRLLVAGSKIRYYGFGVGLSLYKNNWTLRFVDGNHSSHPLEVIMTTNPIDSSRSEKGMSPADMYILKFNDKLQHITGLTNALNNYFLNGLAGYNGGVSHSREFTVNEAGRELREAMLPGENYSYKISDRKRHILHVWKEIVGTSYTLPLPASCIVR